MLLARSLAVMALLFYIGVSILESGSGWSFSSWKEGQRRLWKKPSKAQLAIFVSVWSLVALLILYALFAR